MFEKDPHMYNLAMKMDSSRFCLACKASQGFERGLKIPKMVSLST